MYKKLSMTMTEYIIQKEVGKREYFEIYAYGFEMFVSTSVNIIFLLMLGVVVGLEKEIVFYMIFFSALRNCSGGLHKTTHLSCILTYTCMAFIHIGFMKYLYYTNSYTATMFIFMYLVLSVYLVFKYAPMDSENKRLNEEQKKLQKRKSRRTIIIETVMIIVMFICHYEWYAIVAAAAVATQSITLLPILND